ncbi:hypothetical protein AB1Y20_013093 [Prymnesium parvum]|uniref:Uncharacterized protein n=1 Tax=Prymnesium parvum TaxID=97485 RepID=A0AB34IM54_PRYPA
MHPLSPPLVPLAPRVPVRALSPPPDAPTGRSAPRLLFLVALPAVGSVALPGGISFALSYQLLLLSAVSSPPSLAQRHGAAHSEWEPLLRRHATVASACAAVLVCAEEALGARVDTPGGAALTVACSLAGALARAQLTPDPPREPVVDLLAEQQRDARRLRRSFDSRLSWRARKRRASHQERDAVGHKLQEGRRGVEQSPHA